MKKALSALVGTGIFLVSGAALAQYGGGWSGSYQPAPPPARSSSLDNLGEEAQLTFGVDRVMGLAMNKSVVTPDGGGGDMTYKSTDFFLFGNPGSTSQAPNLLIPRLALDYFVVESISVGGSFLFASSSGEIEPDPATGSGSADAPSTTTLGFMPRVGYLMAFDETFSIWPRAGITYFTSKTEDNATGGSTTTTVNGLELTAEAMVGISPMSNFAILVGPYLDLGLSGNSKNEPPAGGTTTEMDTKTTSFGLTVSILGYY